MYVTQFDFRNAPIKEGEVDFDRNHGIAANVNNNKALGAAQSCPKLPKVAPAQSCPKLPEAAQTIKKEVVLIDSSEDEASTDAPKAKKPTHNQLTVQIDSFEEEEAEDVAKTPKTSAAGKCSL